MRLDPPTPVSGLEHTRRWWQQVNAALAEIHARLVTIDSNVATLGATVEALAEKVTELSGRDEGDTG